MLCPACSVILYERVALNQFRRGVNSLSSRAVLVFYTTQEVYTNLGMFSLNCLYAFLYSIPYCRAVCTMCAAQYSSSARVSAVSL